MTAEGLPNLKPDVSNDVPNGFWVVVFPNIGDLFCPNNEPVFEESADLLKGYVDGFPKSEPVGYVD